jgi:pimeloyl-ACP methyl ester carboxylesterase
MTSRRLDVNGVHTAYRRAGSGEPLLYLHGSGLTDRWLPLYGELARDFDVIAADHPGYGRTPRPRWYRSIDDLAVHYADFLSALGVESVHVVGHSFGGLVAGSFASLFPGQVRSLTLISPGPLPEVAPPDAYAVFAVEPEPDFDFDSLLFNGNQHQYPEHRHADDEGGLLAPADADGLAADGDGLAHLASPPTLCRRLARVAAPAQVLIPDRDLLFGEETFAQWARYLANAPVVRIPGKTAETGHLLIVQEPEAIAVQIAALADRGKPNNSKM